ncbi:MAG: VOC family protein [Sphingobacteriales bacterium]|nr:MAG: VOC family protein [Sphingobacteriales bacterium]
MNQNAIGWVEIPVTDMERAVKFYETVFGFTLGRHPMGELDMSWFPWVENGTGSPGSLVCHKDFYTPSANGTLVYFTSRAGDLNVELSRVEAAGGSIVVPRTHIAEDYGYMAVIMDTEGNRIALHSRV